MRSYDTAMMKTGHGSVPFRVPFYTAKEDHSLQNRRGPFSATEILREVFNEDFRAALDFFVRLYPDDVSRLIPCCGAKSLRIVGMSEPVVVDVFDSGPVSMTMELYTTAGVRADKGDGCADAVVGFSISYVIDYIEKRCSAPIICAVPPKHVFGKRNITPYLLPVMYEEDYPDAAYRLLKAYYPEALNEPIAIDGLELAHRMKLIVRSVRLPKDSDARGLIFFSDSRVKVLDDNGNETEISVLPLTILLNTDLCPTVEIRNSTLVHECVHFFLDYRFFMLQSLSGKPYNSCMGRSLSPIKYVRTNSPIEWMELHAEKLPAYILMEESNTRNYIEDLYDRSHWDTSPGNVMSIVERLAEKFGVSRSMAKYRMIELGFPEAEGVYCFVDGRRIPDHGCSDQWKKGVTYNISRMDAAMLLNRSAGFRLALKSDLYTYLEGHWCLNDRKYIKKDRYGNTRLTDHARRHIDECCIAFTVSGRYSSSEYSRGRAANKAPVSDKYLLRHDMSAEPGSKEFSKQSESYVEDMKRWDELLKSLPDDLTEAVRTILDAKNMTWEKLAEELEVSRTALYKWLGQERVSLRHVVAICIALNLRVDICEALVRIAGYAFRNTVEHMLLHSFLYDTAGFTISKANRIMEKESLPRLTNGKEE